ncbi:MAG: biosynthetic arginine decarboxylase [Armatimonadetes bacterium]|nr:biosynthetic arginine decarboxylase [Armatimonadota bacterium]
MRQAELTEETTPFAGWTIEDSEELYRIGAWGEPYFSISSAGHLTVSPQGDRGGSLDLHELVTALRRRNVHPPLLIRFSDILEDRLDRLQSAFSRAITRYGYPGIYQGVFPVKCNQQRQLVECVVRFGKRHQFGLEAGSKPELLIALAALEGSGSLLICNGYKDREYIETALLAQRLNLKSIVVLEQQQELDMVLEASRKFGIEPMVGVRAKLTAKGEGRWGTSVGDRAKFGLTVPEILEAVEQLRGAGKLPSLQLLHFHIGSQISSIGVIKDALREACQIYVELVKLGAPMGYLDVGGGLAVDYDGSNTNFYASKNYNVQNYANDVVAAVKDACVAANVTVPTLVSESGRALASHQSILVFDVLGVSDVPRDEPEPPGEGAHLVIRNLWETLQSLNSENFQEMYHDANQFKQEAISLFNFGYLGLAPRAHAERLYWAICRRIQKIVRELDYVPDDLDGLEKTLASIYYINLSIFQSAPDTWAMDQLFPIVPIHRLDEEPTERVTLADLTCDSDGKLDQFIDLRDVKHLLELHPLEESARGGYRPYYLALFLAGAYQEILGSLHNLFGDTNAVHIRLTPQGYHIEHVVKGDTMREVLSYVQYDPEDLLENIRRKTERALEENSISIEEAQALLDSYEASLQRYTYLSR